MGEGEQKKERSREGGREVEGERGTYEREVCMDSSPSSSKMAMLATAGSRVTLGGDGSSMKIRVAVRTSVSSNMSSSTRETLTVYRVTEGEKVKTLPPKSAW